MQKLNIKIYFLTLPNNQKNTGDFDYVTKVVNAINRLNKDKLIQAEHITENVISEIKEITSKLGTLSIPRQNNYIDNIARKEVINRVLEYIIYDSAKTGSIPCINLQLHFPNTGFLFCPEDLVHFKNNNIKVFLTCHEYALYHDRPNIQIDLQKFFSLADKIIFLTRYDQKCACDSEKQKSLTKSTKQLSNYHNNLSINKTLLSYVPATITPSISLLEDEANQKPANILMFGMLRPNKGFQYAKHLAEAIKYSILREKS